MHITVYLTCSRIGYDVIRTRVESERRMLTTYGPDQRFPGLEGGSVGEETPDHGHALGAGGLEFRD